MEVAFIALTFGANQGNIPMAALAAAAAVLLVAIVGLSVRAPLSRVPENSMKFVVGVMLTAFGIFWGAEGAGAHWPGDDIALLVLIPAIALYALALVAVFQAPHTRGCRCGSGRLTVRRLRQFGAFLYDFIVGDDWRVALTVAVALGATFVVNDLTGVTLWWIVVAAVGTVLPLTIYGATRSQQ